MKVQLLKDPATGVLKPLMVNGKVAMSEDCCCGGCDCPVTPLHVDGTITSTFTDTTGTGLCSDCSITSSLTASDSYDNNEICGTWNNEFIQYQVVDVTDGSAIFNDPPPTTLTLGKTSQHAFVLGFFASTITGDEITDCSGYLTLTVRWNNFAGYFLGTLFCGSSGNVDVSENFPVTNVHKPQGTYTMDQTFSSGGVSAHAIFVVTVSAP